MRVRGLLVHVVLPVIAGAAIYVLWRAPSLLVFRWLDLVGADQFAHLARGAASPARPLLPSWVLFTLPDALWVYALTACLSRIWRGSRGASRVAWLSVGPVLGVGSELGQLAGVVPGTFDVVDLCAAAAAAALALLLNAREGESCVIVTSSR